MLHSVAKNRPPLLRVSHYDEEGNHWHEKISKESRGLPYMISGRNHGPHWVKISCNLHKFDPKLNSYLKCI